MKFVEKLRMLKTNSVKDTVQRENGSILIEPGNIPKYRHILFQGLKRSDIDAVSYTHMTLPTIA